MGFLSRKKKVWVFWILVFGEAEKNMGIFGEAEKNIDIYGEAEKNMDLFGETENNMGFQIEFSHDYWIGNVSFFNLELTKYKFVFIF